MLLHRDITKTQEIKTLFRQTWKQPKFFAKQPKAVQIIQILQVV
jgi:hypothetical protein